MADRAEREVLVVFEGGPKGDRGPEGPQGDVGPVSTVPGPEGPQGGLGPQGIQGKTAYELWLDAGYSGDIDTFFASQAQDFRYVQYPPATVWYITHPRLNPRPAVRVFDSTDMETEGDIEYTSPHTLTITFTAPLAGEAFLN